NGTRFSSPAQLATVISIVTPEWYTAEMYRSILAADHYNAAVKTKLLSALCNVGSPADIEYVLSQPFTQHNAALLDKIGTIQVQPLTAGSVAAIRNILINNK